MHIYHPSMILYPWPFGGVLHNLQRVVYIFHWDESYVLVFLDVKGRKLRKLSAQDRLRAPNGWNTIGRPQVLGRSVREPVQSIFIGSTGRCCLQLQIQSDIWVGQMIVHISLLHPTAICLLKIKNKIIKFK